MPTKPFNYTPPAQVFDNDTTKVPRNQKPRIERPVVQEAPPDPSWPEWAQRLGKVQRNIYRKLVNKGLTPKLEDL